LKKQTLWLVPILVLALMLSACSMLKPRTALTADQFKTRMEADSFTVEDVTAQFDAGTVDIVLIAYNDDYQIEFYVMPDVDAAEEAFAINRDNFEALSGQSSTTSGSGSNYSYYIKTASDGFYVVSRVENTFIYVEEEATDKDAVKAVLKKLGY
jgi:hypothetical protein